jgi:iron complex outermembrane receptor protein
MRKNRPSKLLLPNLAIVAMLAASPALAQAQSGEDEADAGEIVVTAAKRSENLQSVPIAISAIGGDALSKSRVDTVDSLVTKVTNLQLTAIVGEYPDLRAARGFDERLFAQSSQPGRDLLRRSLQGQFCLPWRGDVRS